MTQPFLPATVPASAVLGRAAITNPTDATDGNTIQLMVDKAGRVVTANGHVRDLVAAQTTTIAASSAETTIITAAGAGVFADLAFLAITMGTTPTACTATLKDATAGTTRGVFDLPATTGQGVVLPFPIPIPQATANNNWTITLSSASPTVHINAVYIKNA
jgi:hypothetical protein